MIQMEDYVTYEQALRLKELGFNWYNRYSQMFYATQCYCEGNNQFFFDTIGPGDLISSPKMKEDENDGWIEDEDYCVLAPTLSQAAKWLREVKGIYVWVEPEINEYDNEIVYLTYVWDNNKRQYPENYDGVKDKDTYEEALSDGISKSLELIINK